MSMQRPTGALRARAGSMRRGRMAVPALALLCATIMTTIAPIATSFGQEATSVPSTPAVSGSKPSRPRIGLALGGGGAKGAAHVGVLTMLEDMRVPIDCVVGTSMGALVGGTYAAGMTAAEVERAVSEISWSQAIGSEGWRQKLPMRRKLAGRTYSNSLEFGYRDGGLSAPSGIINTQNIEQTIRRLVARSLGTDDFDRLPIAFRAIATDMMTGEMVVLSSGDLAQAMRASMAVPGVFAPVTIDGRTLGDGSLTRNVAVDIARQTCADVVIAVTVPTPPPPPEALQSPITMFSRTLDVLIGANERQQLESLGPQDVKIVVPMGEIGSGSFEKVSEAIPLGRRAAEEQRESLRRYSLPEADYQAWREAALRPDSRLVELGKVEVVGLGRVQSKYVEASLGLQPGQQVDQQQLAAAINGVFALGDFDGVRYSFSGDPARPDLRVEVTEKALGPNVLRFDIGVAVGTAGTNAFVLAADYLRPWINTRGGEVHGLAQFGRTSLVDLSLYQPIDPLHRWFVEPGVRVSSSSEDLYLDDEIATRYNFDGAYAYLDAGRVFGTSAELRVGLRNGSQGATREIAFPGLPNLPTEAYGGIYAAFTYDDRDNDALATRGWLNRVRYFRGMDALGSRREYDRLEGVLARSVPLGANLVTMRAAGGARFEGELPFYDLFTLGGPISFPGLGLGQLRGTSYWTTSASYLHKVADISALFGQSLYAGANLLAGDMSGRIDDVREPVILGASLLFGGRTPLGPVTMSFSTTSTAEWSVLVTLGRPIEERAITDPAW